MLSVILIEEVLSLRSLYQESQYDSIGFLELLFFCSLIESILSSLNNISNSIIVHRSL